ncbi:unnamed protein product [Darwinula stevensoni]|uniref:[histone H3]-trimethyl-L-lysine(4) demethylase n=1 Tax=Darwinula stevensoni TaxID=69355 RepID=A0A7R8X620_9CRUS|nr:unnamed protein product [Darwinula stevensoni]CAG0879037.1 unnamed protein product [Darwinula stevensoni]
MPEFRSPPECPVYHPSEDDFQDPLAFIRKIRPIAEEYGLCKIVPPPSWTPPFAVDVDNFKFKPRIQRLNELEACTRIKLNFLDQIAKFWELQGSCLKLPTVEKRALDLYTLYKLVQEEGGFEKVCQDHKWAEIGARMDFPQGKNYYTLLKPCYERILYPYELFKQGKSLSTMEMHSYEENMDYIPHEIPDRQALKPPAERYSRRSKRVQLEEQDLVKTQEVLEMTGNKELRRLKFYGAGPKMSGFSGKRNVDTGGKGKGKKSDTLENDPLAKYVCFTCLRGDDEEQMLLCDGCDDSYHTFCLVPPLHEIPPGDWRCPKCVAREVSKPNEAFGFEQAQKEYTLATFGAMADQFKSDYFSMPVHMVPPDVVEKEFWRVVSCIDEDVTVEYGADLHTMDHGSGFPTKNSKNLQLPDKEYATSPWNLNNLPVLDGSVLGFINADISGMMVPWMGEPKTWYGVPGGKAEVFEVAMRSCAPELFESQPDLLHQLVTTMNPNILMDKGVPIYHADQMAGEFVVTFPRSYHAGFNQGYNFAEAVNFCPPDWLGLGRESILHYSDLRRYCVFSHDELVCKMAIEPNIGTEMAIAAYEDVCKMVDSEKKLRRSLLDWGVVKAELEYFELLADDNRQCDACKTTLFLSAVTCSCTKKLVCLRHYTSLCKCPPAAHKLQYRYTLNELAAMLENLKQKADVFQSWLTRVKQALKATGEDRIELKELKSLTETALTKKFPECELLETLQQAVEEAEKCASVAQQLAATRVRTRGRGCTGGEPRCSLTVEELQMFCDELHALVCRIPDGDAVLSLLSAVESFRDQAQTLLKDPKPSAADLEACMETGNSLDIELPEFLEVKKVHEAICWVEKMEDFMSELKPNSIEVLKEELAKGQTMTPHPAVEKTVASVSELLMQALEFEEQARKALHVQPSPDFLVVEEILEKAKDIPSSLPYISALRELHKKTKDWLTKIEHIKEPPGVFLSELESLVLRGRGLPFVQDRLPGLEQQFQSAKTWMDRATSVFLRRNVFYSLIEVTNHLKPSMANNEFQWNSVEASLKQVLCPRKNLQDKRAHLKKKRPYKDEGGMSILAAILGVEAGPNNPEVDLIAAYKACQNLKPNFIIQQEAAQKEISEMRRYRAENMRKHMDSDRDTLYCICQKPEKGVMIQCELCRDSFHATCIPLSRPSGKKDKGGEDGSVGGGGGGMPEDLFMCPLCQRSQRPRLENILSLLVAFQKLTVRLPEAEALQSLTEQAMDWQDRARHALSNPDLSRILGKSGGGNPGVSASRSECYSWEDRTRSPSPSPGHPSPSADHNVDNDLMCHETCPEDMDHDPSQMSKVTDNSQSSFGSSEHAYSFASKPGGMPTTSKKHGRKSPLVPRDAMDRSWETTIRDNLKNQLEKLLLEGLLMELYLDETSHLWNVLQIVRAPDEVRPMPSPKVLERELLLQRKRMQENQKAKAAAGATQKKPMPQKRPSDKSTLGEELAKKKGKGGASPRSVGSPGSPTDKKIRKSRPKQVGVKPRATAEAKRISDNEEMEEDCAAVRCRKPTEKKQEKSPDPLAKASPQPSSPDIQALVSEAVKKVLLEKKLLDGKDINTKHLISKAASKAVAKSRASALVYRPTPIAELQKRREVQGLSVCAVVPDSNSEDEIPKSKDDEYVPLGSFQPDAPSYMPGSAGTATHEPSYCPNSVSQNETSATYLPSAKASQEPSYEPGSNKNTATGTQYHPTCRAKLTQRSEEYVPPGTLVSGVEYVPSSRDSLANKPVYEGNDQVYQPKAPGKLEDLNDFDLVEQIIAESSQSIEAKLCKKKRRKELLAKKRNCTLPDPTMKCEEEYHPPGATDAAVTYQPTAITANQKQKHTDGESSDELDEALISELELCSHSALHEVIPSMKDEQVLTKNDRKSDSHRKHKKKKKKKDQERRSHHSGSKVTSTTKSDNDVSSTSDGKETEKTKEESRHSLCHKRKRSSSQEQDSHSKRKRHKHSMEHREKIKSESGKSEKHKSEKHHRSDRVKISREGEESKTVNGLCHDVGKRTTLEKGSELKVQYKKDDVASTLTENESKKPNFNDDDLEEMFGDVDMDDFEEPLSDEVEERKPEAMLERLRKLQTTAPPPPDLNCMAVILIPGGKKRIAHVPNVYSLMNAKHELLNRRLQLMKQPTNFSAGNPSESQPSTSSGASASGRTIGKGEKRVAHVPKQAMEYGSKVPASVRQRYLNTFIDELLKTVESEQEAFDRALEEEAGVYVRSSNKTVYLNLACNMVTRLRKETEVASSAAKGESQMPSRNPTVSHLSILAGKGGARGSWSIEKPKKPSVELDDIHGSVLYHLMLQYVASPEQLEENRYPCPDPETSGRAIWKDAEKQTTQGDPTMRTCIRCGRNYRVDVDGFQIKNENCSYHWGRSYNLRFAGGRNEKTYVCCKGDLNTDGCCLASVHVSEPYDPSIQLGYVTTYEAENPNDDCGVFALDCEMCYTTQGNELTRVTVIGSHLETVYETLVKPEKPILDYNTRFSGIQEEDMKHVTTRLQDVQAHLLSLFSDKTILIGHSLDSDLRALKDDYEFQLTKCDAKKGRWRISVPKVDNICSGGESSPAPVRLKECYPTCDPGEHFDLSTLQCEPCPAGTYSLGNGLLLDSWDPLPEGFQTTSEEFSSTSSLFFSYERMKPDCHKYGWKAQGNYLASISGFCVTSLIYTVTLVRRGILEFSYQYPDDNVLFEFEIAEENCEVAELSGEIQYPLMTEQGQWKTVQVNLFPGPKVFQWRTVGMDDNVQPVLLNFINITGVLDVPKCITCPKGTYSQASRSTKCELCPKDTYAGEVGSRKCTACDLISMYAPKGSSQCFDRPFCTPRDFIEFHSPCKNNQTVKSYEWMEPKVCRENVSEAVSLPPKEEVSPCPPCNPVCGEEERSFHWQPAGDHIRTPNDIREGSYVILNLPIPGFRRKESFNKYQAQKVGYISFSFELQCQSPCQLTFFQQSDHAGISFIGKWREDSSRITHYTHPVYRNDSYIFRWVFHRVSWGDTSVDATNGWKRFAEPPQHWGSVIARIYTINVTNTIDGGASNCLPCPAQLTQMQESSEAMPLLPPSGMFDGCITCPIGQYYDWTNGTCASCPPNMILPDPFAMGPDACQECGPGLVSLDGQNCIATCKFSIEGSFYDLQKLAIPAQVQGAKLFTASGSEYYNVFNISLCGTPLAECTNNVSWRKTLDIFRDSVESSIPLANEIRVESYVCRSTLVPAGDGKGHPPLAAMALSFGDTILGITRSPQLDEVKVHKEFINPKEYPKDIHFYYTTVSVVLGECQDGHQKIHYLPPSTCLPPEEGIPDGEMPCSTAIPFMVQLVVVGSVTLAMLLALTLALLYRKKRRLEYKYMRLVEKKGDGAGYGVAGGETGLGSAESCALHEDEDDDEDGTDEQRGSRVLFSRLERMVKKLSHFEGKVVSE